MKAKIASILSAIFILFTAACGSGDTQLAKAERLLVHHPDSALLILSQHATDTPQSIILKALAADLTDTPMPGDSLLSRAASYYASGNDAKMQFLALYCTGRSYQLHNHDAKAMLQYTQAEHLIEDIDNAAYAALLYTRLAQLYSNARL